MEPTFSQVAAWSHAIAAVIHALFAVYLGLAWRNGSRGSFLIAAMGLSALWASANWAFVLTGWNWLFLLGNLLDVLRMGAWFGFLVALVFQPTAEYEGEVPPRWPKPMTLAVVSLGAAGVLCFSMGLPV